jgi:DNA polymerase-3 subunit beta
MMEFKIKKYVAQSLLEKAALALASTDGKPILKNYYFKLTPPDTVLVIATDLALSIVAKTTLVEMKGDAYSKIVFPGERLLEIVRSAEDDVMTFTVTGGRAGDKGAIPTDVEVTCARSKWNLKLMDPSDYPDIPDAEKLEYANIDRKVFLEAVQRTRVAAPMGTYRPGLSMISIANGKMQAADGIRMHQMVVPFAGKIQIPIQATEDLVRFLKITEDEKVYIAQTDNHIVFKFGVDVFIATKATAEFPDIEKVFTAPTLAAINQKFTVDRQQLIDGIKRVRLTADVDTNLVVMTLGDNKMILAAKDRYGNKATQDLDLTWNDGERVIGVNWNFMLLTLQQIAGPTVEISLGPDTKNRKTPLLFTEPGFIAILNQLRITEGKDGGKDGQKGK